MCMKRERGRLCTGNLAVDCLAGIHVEETECSAGIADGRIPWTRDRLTIYDNTDGRDFPEPTIADDGGVKWRFPGELSFIEVSFHQ